MHKDWDEAGQTGLDPNEAAAGARCTFEEKANGKQEESARTLRNNGGGTSGTSPGSDHGPQAEQPEKGRSEEDQPRIKLIPFDEIKLDDEPEYLIDELIPAIGITVVWGPPKSHKSFWMFDAAMHVALGWKYRGRQVQQATVAIARSRVSKAPRNDAPLFVIAFSPRTPILSPSTCSLSGSTSSKMRRDSSRQSRISFKMTSLV